MRHRIAISIQRAGGTGKGRPSVLIKIPTYPTTAFVLEAHNHCNCQGLKLNVAAYVCGLPLSYCCQQLFLTLDADSGVIDHLLRRSPDGGATAV